jgi:hypothetical protein
LNSADHQLHNSDIIDDEYAESVPKITESVRSPSDGIHEDPQIVVDDVPSGRRHRRAADEY